MQLVKSLKWAGALGFCAMLSSALPLGACASAPDFGVDDGPIGELQEPLTTCSSYLPDCTDCCMDGDCGGQGASDCFELVARNKAKDWETVRNIYTAEYRSKYKKDCVGGFKGLLEKLSLEVKAGFQSTEEGFDAELKLVVPIAAFFNCDNLLNQMEAKSNCRYNAIETKYFAPTNSCGDNGSKCLAACIPGNGKTRATICDPVATAVPNPDELPGPTCGPRMDI